MPRDLEKQSEETIGLHRALVTGAAGFIGRHLVKKLVAGGCHVKALDLNANQIKTVLDRFPGRISDSVQIVQADLTDSTSLDAEMDRVEMVFHTAGKVHSVPRNRREEEEFFRVNVAGTENLLRSCQKPALRAFVLFSTIAVYGPNAPGPLQETTSCHPEGAYARSKYEAEQTVLRLFRGSGTRATVFRMSLVYGEGERGNFQRMVRGIDTGRFVFIGGGQTKKSVTYVENIVEAALLAANSESAAGHVFNVADPSPYTLQHIVETTARHLGVSPPVMHLPVPLARLGGRMFGLLGRLLGFSAPFTEADVQRLVSDAVCDVSKIREVLGFEARIGLEEGVARTVQWYRKNHSHPK